MKYIFYISLAVCLLAGVVLGQKAANGTNETPKSDRFKELITKLKAGDTSIDFKAFRFASVDSDEKDAGASDRDLVDQAGAAYDKKDYKKAIELGEKALQTGYVDINTHLILAAANREANNNDKFAFHKAVYLGLINSILDGADGRSAKTAFHVITVSEEYSVLGALGLQRGDQALSLEDGHRFDVLTVTDPKSKKTLTLYFNIDLVWKGYEKIFKD